MNWNDTVASSCRYGSNAGTIWGDWDVIWEESHSDYQGEAKFLAKKNNTYVFYEWTYGSCGGCDDWEYRNLTDVQIEAEMKRDAIEFDGLNSKEHLANWCRMLEEVKGEIPPFTKCLR